MSRLTASDSYFFHITEASMSTMQLMNPTLYRRLVYHFGPVKIRHPGEARADQAYRLGTDFRQVSGAWGETYAICCPFCRESNFQLGINYMYGQCDKSGRPFLHMACCHAHNCLAEPQNRLGLAEMISADDGLLGRARIHQGTVVPANRVIDLPAPLTRLDRLRRGHPARLYVREYGFDPDRLGRCYDVRFCSHNDDPVANHRIIVPVRMYDQLRGWLSVSIGRSQEGGDKNGRALTFFSARGMSQSRLLYNRDRASRYQTGILVTTPADVWSLGPMALSLLGDTASEYQGRLFLALFRQRTAVILVPAGQRRRSPLNDLIDEIEFSMGNRVAVVERPRDLPPGAQGRAAWRAYVTREARAQGVKVRYRKCE
jgi:hypothetical protein